GESEVGERVVVSFEEIVEGKKKKKKKKKKEIYKNNKEKEKKKKKKKKKIKKKKKKEEKERKKKKKKQKKRKKKKRKKKKKEKIKVLGKKGAKTHNEWQKKIKEIDVLRNEFFEVGKVPIKVNEATWASFKTAVRNFNKKKNSFYKDLKKDQYDNLQKKLDLIK